MSGIQPAPSGIPPTASSSPASASPSPFPPDEEKQLIKDDIHAAALVSGLMSLIFVMGLVLYIGVLFSCL